MNTKHEPVLIRAFIAAAVQLLLAFGVAVSVEQAVALEALAVAALPLVTLVAAYFARRKVSPVEEG